MSKPKCPKCGSGDLAFDWTGTTSLLTKGGEVKAVTRGGVTNSYPDRIVCFECGHEGAWEGDPEMEQAVEILLAVLPNWIQDELSNGKDVFRLEER
jgi:hypothetical protein